MALPNLNLVGACEAVRTEIERLQGENSAYGMRSKIGALDALFSAENEIGDVQITELPSQTKFRRLHLLFDQRTVECEASDDCDVSICDDGTDPGRREAFVEIDQCASTPLRQYSALDMSVICKDPLEYFYRRAISDIRAARERMDINVLGWLDDNVGKNRRFNGSTTAAGSYTTLQILGSQGGQAIPLTGNYAEIDLDYANNLFLGRPIKIGQGNLELYAKLNQMACCNSATPFGNGSELERIYVDQYANRVLGANKAIVMAPGAARIITWNINKTIEQVNSNNGDSFNRTIPDPDGYPFEWNWDMKWDDCSKTWKILYSVAYTIFSTYPEDSFKGTGDCIDPNHGVNGIFGYDLTRA